MAITAPSDIFSPDVVAGLAYEQAFERINLLKSGYIADARATATRENASDNVLFPYVKETAANAKVQVNPRTGVAVTPDKFEIDYETVALASKLISIQNDEKSLRKMAAHADPNQLMANTVTKWMQANIQAALITSGAATALTSTEVTNVANIKGIKKAMIVNWADDANEAAPLVVLHSKCAYDLEVSEEVMKTGVYGGLRPGEITSMAGINWLMLDQVTSSGSGAATLYNNLIIMPGALELWMDPNMGYGEQRTAATTAWISDWWWEFCTHLTRRNPRGVIKYICGSTLNTD